MNPLASEFPAAGLDSATQISDSLCSTSDEDVSVFPAHGSSL